MPLLLLTRPEPAARRFAAQAAHLGLDVVISPVLRIVGIAHDRARADQASGLVFTSENAVPFAGPGRGRPAICVGPRTAEVAQAAGFQATAGPGDAARLLPLLAGLDAGWLHLHGIHRARELPVPGMAVYDQEAIGLNDRARAALGATAPVLLPLFSPRTARILSDDIGEPSAPLWLAPISPAAHAAWRGPVARLAVAPTPDADGVLIAMTRLLAQEQS